MTKPYGFGLWAGATVFFLTVGLVVARKRAPELKYIQESDTPMEMILALAEAPGEKIDIYFKRPLEEGGTADPSVAFVSFYSPRAGIPPKIAPNHFRFQMSGQSLFESIVGLMHVVKYELPHKGVTFHFGWPQSSWLDRLSIGVMVFSIMKLPKEFPQFNFAIEYFGKKQT